MKKKILALLLVAIFAMAFLTACSPAVKTDDSMKNNNNDSSEDGNTNDGSDEETYTFKHGFDLDYPPYSYLQDDGSIGGFDVTVCQAVCEYLGWEYESVPFNWDAKDAELTSGACDCIWSGFTVEGREDDYLWSIPYSNNIQVIMTSADSGIETLEDLAGKLVGVQVATSALSLLEEGGDAEDLAATFGQLLQYETYTVAFNDLKAGAIDAIAIDMPVAKFLMQDNEGFAILDDELGRETYAIGFRLGDQELCDQINAALLALSENGTFDEIAKDYPDIADFLCLGKNAD